MSIELTQTFFGSAMGGASSAIVVRQSYSNWLPFKGLDSISERDLYTLTDHPELVHRLDLFDQQSTTTYWTMGFMAGGGAILMVASEAIWPGYNCDTSGGLNRVLAHGASWPGALFALTGFALTCGAPVLLLTLPRHAVNYRAAIDIAEEYNHNLRISLQIVQ